MASRPNNIALDIERRVLEHVYRKQLKRCCDQGEHSRRRKSLPQRTGEGREAVTAAIFWPKTRAGWKETTVHEVNTGVSGMSLEQIDDRIRALVGPIEEVDPGWGESVLAGALTSESDG